MAAGTGHYDILEYAFQNGCDWDPNVESYCGRLPPRMAKWARDHGCIVNHFGGSSLLSDSF